MWYVQHMCIFRSLRPHSLLSLTNDCYVSCVCAAQVLSYVLQGRLEEARQMLVKQATLRPAARNMYKLMDGLLSKMPFYNVSTL